LNAEVNPLARPKIANSIVDVIGGTPIIRLNRLAKGVGANILLKLESMEPANSVKDRIGKSMIEEAEKVF
jgi:cysteine synthase A